VLITDVSRININLTTSSERKMIIEILCGFVLIMMLIGRENDYADRREGNEEIEVEGSPRKR